MTPSDMLRGWALGMRSLLECCGGREMSITLDGGQVVVYRRGEGLLFSRVNGDELTMPEEALDEERWQVCDGR